MEAIKTVDLTKKYKNLVAVNKLNLTIEEGELFSLLGVNGAGKTTTIRMLSTLTKPDGGDAFLMGHSIKSEALCIKQLIGVSPQETAIAPGLTVRENLKLIGSIYGFSKEAITSKIDELAVSLDLTSILDKKAGKLSGGMKRRLSIAMALVCEPKILFLDEPSLGLDVLARNELWDVILALKGKITIILTTHYMEEAEALADRVGIMKDGVLITTGTVDELKERTGEDRFDNVFIKIIKEASV